MGNLLRLLRLISFLILNLNVCILSGQKITALKNKALEGDAGSQLQLGFLYSKGPLEDKKEALYWMTMAARERMPSACRYLGFAYLEGKGTAHNKNLARKWFTLGSAMRDTLSMIGLAECLSNSEEEIERTAWLLLANDLNEPQAVWRLEQSMKSLTLMEKKLAKEEANKLEAGLPPGSKTLNKKYLVTKKRSLTLPDRSRYKGAVKNGVPHGFGERTSQDGEIYQGSFIKGKEEGYGTLFGPQGLIIYEGLWTEGNPVDTLLESKKTK